MARKLSGVARQRFFLSLGSSAVVLSITSSTVSGETPVRVSAPPSVIQNPFARQPTGEITKLPSTSSETSSALPANAPLPSTGKGSPVASIPTVAPTIQKNPFALQPSTPPPFEIPIMPGPVSRWRQSMSQPRQQRGVNDAILSAEETLTHKAMASETSPIEHRWDRLPPAEVMRDQLVKSTTGNSGKSQQPQRSLDSIDFAPAKLDQPEWMAPEHSGALRIDATTTFRRIPDFDPFEDIASDDTVSTAEPAPFTAAEEPDGLAIGSTKAPPEPDMLSVIVSDYVDSPEGWYARAQQAAQTAQTAEELSAVIDDCQRCLQTGADIATIAAVNRLAAWAYNRRGELAIEIGRELEALRDFESAIALDSQCWLALHNRGVTLAQQNDFESALADFNRVIELNPGLAIAYRNRAELLASLGQMEDAVDDYGTAIRHLPQDARLYFCRGYALHRLGEFDRALNDLNRSIELADNSPETYTQRANLQAERGHYGEAIEDLKAALRLDPNYGEALRSAAWLLATCPDPAYRDAAQALAAAQQAAQLGSPDDYFLLDALAAAHANAGQFDEAADILRRAIASASPDFLAELEQRLVLYEQHQAFRSKSAPKVQPASHEQ